MILSWAPQFGQCSRSISPGAPEFEHDLPGGVDLYPFIGQCGSGDGAAKPARPGRRRWGRMRRGAAVLRGLCRGDPVESVASPPVAPQGRASVTVVGNGRKWLTSVTGKSTNSWFDTGNWKLASGRISRPKKNSPARRPASSARRCAARYVVALRGRPAWSHNWPRPTTTKTPSFVS